FHMWTPDVYQGAPSPVTGFMAAVAKVGAFAALLRVFVSSFGVLRADWQPVVYAVAVVTLLLGAGLAVVQRDIKRMLAYSAINHAGFVLLGVEAATARGVSASLYYFFVYTFMVIGSFAVVSLLGRRGDVVHDISSYRGLARRQPALALCFAVLLLAQAGVPFTTGLWAKVEVVLAAIDANALPLGVIAMVSAALAAFFYLRVAVLMYTPVAVGAGSAEVAQQPAEDPVALTAGTVGPYLAPGDEEALAEAGSGPADGAGDGQPGNARPVWAGIERSVAVIDRLNAALLIGAGPTGADGATGGADGATGGADGATGGADGATGPGQAGGEETGVPPSDLTGKVPVPVLTAVAIGLCVAVTVVFGIIPAPLVDFARHATLLFLP
ncbi:MAG: NADH-quinone oxidoreductase subunit N, partial [Acidimicrobiales bacterium]